MASLLNKSSNYQIPLKASVGWAFLLVAIWVLPIATLRPNRIMAGVPYDMFQLIQSHFMEGFRPMLSETMAQLSIWMIILAFLCLIGGFTFMGIQKRSSLPLMVLWLSHGLAGIPALVLVMLANLPIDAAVYDPSVIRISLSSGFWFLLVGILMIQKTGNISKTPMGLTGILLLFVMFAGWTPEFSLYKEYLNVRAVFLAELVRHALIALSSVAVATLPGILMGYLSYRHSQLKSWVIHFVNLFQIIPTLSLLGLIMLPLTFLASQWPILNDLGIRGIGFAPAFIVLVLYCLLPMTTNALEGFEKVDPAVLESARAMGMTERQIVWTVLLPLASPIMLSGVRIALTQTIGNAILAGLIGGGGLGTLIFLGLSQAASDLVMLGTIPVVLLALASDYLFGLLEKWTLRKAGVDNDRIEISQ